MVICPVYLYVRFDSIFLKILNKRMKNPRINVEKMPKDIDGTLAPTGIISMRGVWLDYDLQ